MTTTGGPRRVAPAIQPAQRNATRFTPSPTEWETFAVEPVRQMTFRAEFETEGKIAVDEDRSTPIFSPYGGRVTRLLAAPGEDVRQGQPLCVIEAPDTVEAQNEFIAALTGHDKAASALELAEIQFRRARELYEGRAVPLKDFQQAETSQAQAREDLRSSQTALDAARNKLQIMGFSVDAITRFQNKGGIDREFTILAPISGTVLQRKVGPGQYVSAGSSDPVFVIGDLSTVWVHAYVRESNAATVAVGQEMRVNVMALPGELTTHIAYVAAAIDPATRRLLVRASLANRGGLKPEMFADVTVFSGADHEAPAVPRQALIHEGEGVRVWVAHADKSVELRQITTGLVNGDFVEVTDHLKAGEQIVSRGSLFIDRAAQGS
ncbi:MAG: efflux RND transporter periplasmic adaptor subunit [Alphaproteobacteria bacterium]|nr:efflux RND transporter periplasmic adaptor subunit [Alphaproteobacteria bacterium]